MSGEPQYTQIKRPVSRVAEKVLGWLNWIGLLFLTVITMFIALVSFSNNTSIQNLEQAINGNQFAQQVLTNNSLNTTQFVIWLQNGIWAVIVYLIVCLLISFLALISMNIRVLSGILFLIASIITLPLVLLLATIVIPVLFFIVAIMMFARKDKVETVPYYPGAYGGYDDYYGSDYDDRYYDRNRQGDRRNPRYDEREEYEEDDVKRYEPKRKASKPAYETEKNEAYDESVNESHPSDEAGQNEQATPDFLSRQAKYKQKSADEVKEQQENDAYEREQARINAMDQEEEPEEIKYRDTEPKKGETAEEKEARKLEKKERKKRAKEARKNRPSAVNQRRMNFEERRSHLVGKSNEKENTQTPEDKDNQKQQENKE